ncbi:MAG: CoA transferase [Gammaproteobacteria bacterium]|nr:CoA transferase [Gammaproteobacteria bacterium]MBI5619153.1 CoA transferase [Gammaproteobacteria bacterium]
MTAVLEGIRVLDFGRYIAGPFCACLLGDMGADVIRVERLEGSEDRFIASVCESGEGGSFLQLNRNKRGFTLDPMKPAGREVVARLAATADVVVANLPAATLKQMGIDYETLCRSRPDIILTHCSAFGNDGPYADRVGFDLLGQGMSGASYLAGDEDGPARSHINYVDFSAALFAAYGTLAALMARAKTGRGQIVEASLFTSALALANNFLVEQSVLEVNRKPHGNRGHHVAPNDIFQTKDGWICSMVVGNPLFERWAKLMGEPHWISDPRYATDSARGNHSKDLSDRMARWCAERTTEQAIAELDRARVPAGPVYSPADVLEDPHVQARELFRYVEYPGVTKPAPIIDTPVRLSDTPGSIRHRAPLLGEHTDEILASLGYSSDDIARLREQRVV